MKYYLTAITLFISLSASSQTDSLHHLRPRLVLERHEGRLSNGQRWATIGMFVPATVLMINNHEIGHTVVARLSGDRSSHYYFYRNNGLGYNVYDHTKLSRFGNTIVPFGGVIFSQGLAQLSDLALRKVPMTPFLQRSTAMVYVMAKFDMSFQVLQGILNAKRYDRMAMSGRPSLTDMVDVAYFTSNGNHRGFSWTMVGMVSIAALDIYLSRHQIRRSWNILFNRRRYVKPGDVSNRN